MKKLVIDLQVTLDVGDNGHHPAADYLKQIGHALAETFGARLVSVIGEEIARDD